jgi:hypothetical protein
MQVLKESIPILGSQRDAVPPLLPLLHQLCAARPAVILTHSYSGGDPAPSSNSQ